MTYNCTSINLSKIDTIQRFGFNKPSLYDKCTIEDFLGKVLIGDFKDDLNNCIFRGECANYDTLMIVMTVCYAYCLLKICILFMVCFYQKNRIQSITDNIELDDPKKAQNDIVDQNINHQNNGEQNVNGNENLNIQIIGQNSQQVQETNQNKNVKYVISKKNKDELNTYERSIKWNIYIEIAMAFRDFLLFRGLGFFVSYLYEVVFVYSNNQQENQVEISTTQCISPNLDMTTYCKNDNFQERLFFYISSVDTCYLRQPFLSLESEQNAGQQEFVMIFIIIFWIITECLASSFLFFNTQVLSHVNEGGKEQKDINRKFLKYSVGFFFSQCIVMSILIFVFKIRLYFRFQSQEVIIFYLVWKSLGFMLLYDQYNKKYYLSSKLYIDIVYDKKQNWINQEKQNYINAKKICENSNILPAIKAQYLDCLKEVHEYLSIKCEEKQKEQEKKIEFSWNSYLKFVLITLSLGIIGLALCLIHYSINQQDATSSPTDQKYDPNQLNNNSFKFGKYLNFQWIYWLGFVLCMLESAIYEIFNSVLLLHSYYLQLFEQMAPIDKKNTIDPNQNLEN